MNSTITSAQLRSVLDAERQTWTGPAIAARSSRVAAQVLDGIEARLAALPPEDDAGVWTVLGVWIEDEAIPVGAIAGRHDVHGEQPYEYYEQGTWATSVTADDPDAAQALAAAEMLDQNEDDEDDEDEQETGS